MVRWLSETKSVKLPGEKVQVNYLYTWPYGLKEIQEMVSDSLKDFGEWGSDYLNVWVCRNDKEWEEAHGRLIISIPKEVFGALEKPTVRMVYTSTELQNLMRVREERTLRPNLIINAREFSKAGRAKKPLIKHEFSHKLEIDHGYYTPIQEAFMKFTEKYSFHPNSKTFILLFTGVKIACDDISANEVCIDFGFKDDVFISSTYGFERIKRERYENVLGKFSQVLMASSYPIPFEHKGEEGYARKMRKVTNDYLEKVESFDAVGLREDLEDILDKVKNPTKLSEIEVVYEGIERKFETFLKEM
jgi:hypothetical protein